MSSLGLGPRAQMPSRGPRSSPLVLLDCRRTLRLVIIHVLLIRHSNFLPFPVVPVSRALSCCLPACLASASPRPAMWEDKRRAKRRQRQRRAARRARQRRVRKQRAAWRELWASLPGFWQQGWRASQWADPEQAIANQYRNLRIRLGRANPAKPGSVRGPNPNQIGGESGPCPGPGPGCRVPGVMLCCVCLVGPCLTCRLAYEQEFPAGRGA